MPKTCSKVAQKVCKVARVTYRDCTKKEQPEAETSLRKRSSSGLSEESASCTSDERERNGIKM